MRVSRSVADVCRAVPTPVPASATRPQIGVWELERRVVQAFREANAKAGGTLGAEDRRRIRTELSERFDVRRTAVDWLKDCALALTLFGAASAVIAAVLALG